MHSKYFYCYSFKMKDFIKENGLQYITKAINPKTQTPYFMFEKSQMLDNLIKKWNQIKYEN